MGLAPMGQEGAASASLQVAETIGVATGTGAAGALFALAGHLSHPMSEGLLWGFLIALAAILVALLPAGRLAPTLRWPILTRTRPSGAIRPATLR